ncbi:hypothetical protein [Bradyrhizobium embrapense]
MSSWIAANWNWLLIVGVALAAQWEIRKVHHRIDAIIELLRQRGIDIYRSD